MSPNQACQIVLLRGLGRSSVHWGPFVSLLQNKTNLLGWPPPICLDLPGNGSQHTQVSPFSVSEYIESLQLQLLEIESAVYAGPQQGSEFQNVPSQKLFNVTADGRDMPLVLIGISLGGMVATAWAKQYPKRVRELILINSSGRDLGAFYDRLRPVNYLNLLQAVTLPAISSTRWGRVWFENKILKMTAKGFSAEGALLNAFASAPETKVLNLVRQLVAAARFRFGSEKPMCQVKILAGLRDEFVNPQCSRKLGALWNVPVFENPEAGHDLPLTHPEWVLQKMWPQES